MTLRDVIGATTGGPSTVATLLHDLQAFGVRPGTTLMVHASLSALGYVNGAYLPVIEALTWCRARGHARHADAQRRLVVVTFEHRGDVIAFELAPRIAQARRQVGTREAPLDRQVREDILLADRPMRRLEDARKDHRELVEISRPRHRRENGQRRGRDGDAAGPMSQARRSRMAGMSCGRCRRDGMTIRAARRRNNSVRKRPSCASASRSLVVVPTSRKSDGDAR